MVVTKASQRLHYLRVLKRSGFPETELVQIYIARLRSILGYACQVWHPALTQHLMHDIERVQIRALRIINPSLSYWQSLDKHNLQTMEQRRINLCKRMYCKIKDPDNIIHHLLPAKKEHVYNLRHKREYETIRTRVKRSDGSFINYAIANFD